MIHGQVADFGFGLFQLGLQYFGRTAGDGFFAAVVTLEGLFLDFRVDGDGGLAVEAVAQVFDLAR